MSSAPQEIDGLYNFRDTGGMPLTGGGSTRPGVLYRSAALNAVTDEGLTELAATDIGVIVDFRTPQETAAAPDRVPTSRPFAVHHVSIMQGAMGEAMKDALPAPGQKPSPETIEKALASFPALDDMYVQMLEGGAEAFAGVARLIAAETDDAPTAVLVHCTAGKDRTGIATALMLDAAGAERSAVVADYAQSEKNLAGPWADGILHMITTYGVPLTPSLVTLATGTPPEAIEKAFSWIDAQGGSAAYLRSGGLTDDELTALVARIAG